MYIMKSRKYFNLKLNFYLNNFKFNLNIEFNI